MLTRGLSYNTIVRITYFDSNDARGQLRAIHFTFGFRAILNPLAHQLGIL